MTGHDREEINSRVVEICEHYLRGPGRPEGRKRRIWRCPYCGGDCFAANSDLLCAGCLSSSCAAPRATDSLGLIALFEGWQTSGAGFLRCLQKGREILSIPAPAKPGEPPRRAARKERASASTNGPGPRRKHVVRRGGGPAEPTPPTPSQSPAVPGECGERRERRDLLDRVYGRVLELCPLEDRDRRFWESRGVGEHTMREGGFGSLSSERSRYLLRELGHAFSREELLAVPGFYPASASPNAVRTNLHGDYTLIPYHDREGRIATIEGRLVGEPKNKRDKKYKAPVGSANHLYVFPRYRPDEVLAFCEGPIGAIVAAQEGIPVGAIKGCWCFRDAGTRGSPDRPLPELEGVYFAGLRRVYVPDLDVKPATRQEVEELAPLAAHWLIAAQNGRPFLARLPEGHKDLDEWLLSLPAAGGARRAAFAELFMSALPPESWRAGT